MDNPSCPSCGHWNALLGATDESGKECRVCRDCGCQTDVEGKALEPKLPDQSGGGFYGEEDEYYGFYGEGDGY